MVAVLKEIWLVQEYQHGRLDTNAGPVAFETENEALEYAYNYASDIPYTKSTEHEIVIFKAHQSYRGNLTAERHNIRKDTTKE